MTARRLARGATAFGLAGLFWSAASPPALGQQALCPVNPLLSNGVRASEVSLQAGLCTNRGTLSAQLPRADGGFPTGAFSGAALATQALTELTQSTIRETTRSVQDSINRRRNEERELCQAGFTLAGGSCATGRSVAVPGAPGRAAPDPAEPFHLSSWTVLYGDQERRSASGSAEFVAGAWGGGTTALDVPISVRTRSGTVGFAFGGDATTRGVIAPDDGLILGLSLGTLSGDMTIATSSGPSDIPVPAALGPASSLTRAAFSGLTTGAYIVYFDKGFSADFLIKADVLTLDESFTDQFSFTHAGEGSPPLNASYSGAGRFALVGTTLSGNIDYRFVLTPNLWIEPTLGVQYTHSAYGDGAAYFGLDDGDLVMVQGGARIGIPVQVDSRMVVTTSLTGLAYSDVLVSGGFVPGAAFLANNILVQADRGEVRGRGVLAVSLDHADGVSAFVQGEARGGKGLFGAGGRAGVRVVW